jgi:hypothetical protein
MPYYPEDGGNMFSKTFVTRATLQHISEDNILNCYHCEKLSQKTAFFEPALSLSLSLLLQMGLCK